MGNDFERVLNHFGEATNHFGEALNHFEGIENDLEQVKNHFEQVWTRKLTTIERQGGRETRKLGKAEGRATESWPQMGAASGTMQVKEQPKVGTKGEGVGTTESKDTESTELKADDAWTGQTNLLANGNPRSGGNASRNKAGREPGVEVNIERSSE